MKPSLLVISALLLVTSHAFSQAHSDTTMLDGHVSRKQVEKYTWFKSGIKAYLPNQAVMDSLKTHRRKLKGMRIVLVLGTWCSDSKEHVPAFFKVADEAGLKDVELIAVSRKKVSRTVDVSPLGIEHVPAFIVYRNKKELGRIVEQPEGRIESDLLKIVGAAR